MAWKQVNKYWLGYSTTKKQFYVYYRLAGEVTVNQIFASPEEFLGLSDMFRNESPINYDTERKYFATADEELGENEPSS